MAAPGGPAEAAAARRAAARWPVARVASGLYAGHLWGLASISLSNVLVGLTLLATLFDRTGEPRRRLFPAAARPMLWAVGVYVVLLLAAIVASYDPGYSLRAVSEIFTLTTLLLALTLVRDERSVRRLVDGLVAVATLVAVAGLVQLLGDYGAIDRRIRGPFSHWMTFSGFLLVCDLLLVARLLSGRRPRGAAVSGRAPGWTRLRTGWRWLALAAINLALLWSLTRSAWVAFAAALTLLVVLRAPKLLLAWVPAALAFVLLAPVPLLARVTSIVDLRDRSNYDRLCMTEAAFHMIAERPLFGIGPDEAEPRYPIYRAPSAPRISVPHLHNSFLQLAAERGLPALASYLAMVGLAVAAAWRGFAREGRFAGGRADLWLGSLAALVAFNLAGLFENNWGDTEVQRLALFVLAVPFCLAGAAEDSAAADPPAPPPP